MKNYQTGNMCPFVMAEVGGGLTINGIGGSSYKWTHTPCMGDYCRMWRSHVDSSGNSIGCCSFELIPTPAQRIDKNKPSPPNDRSLNNRLYKYFLAEKYNIKKHEILSMYLFDGCKDLYESLEEALSAADETEKQEIEAAQEMLTMKEDFGKNRDQLLMNRFAALAADRLKKNE
jgi:hypothetical protein